MVVRRSSTRSRGSVHEPGVHGSVTQESIQISMDGKGRAIDNVMVERLWRTVKYEEIYLKSYAIERSRLSCRIEGVLPLLHTRPSPTRAWATGHPGKPSKSLSETDPPTI